MGAKKKKEKGEGGGKKDDDTPKAPAVIKRENWVNIDFKLLNWKFMNFSMKFRENTHVFTIKKILQERHGRMDDLKLCLNSFADVNEITDEMMTLRDCGLKGHPVAIPGQYGVDYAEENKGVPTFQLFYDFKPTNFSDPVILYFK